MNRPKLYAEFARPFTLLPPALGVVSGAITAWGAGHQRSGVTLAVCIEIANIHLNCRRDPAAAACWYRRAAALPDAPYYAARIYAELLKRLGRQREAYVWLRQLHPTLPPGEESAGALIVLERIRGLEKVLVVPDSERYVVNKLAR